MTTTTDLRMAVQTACMELPAGTSADDILDAVWMQCGELDAGQDAAARDMIARSR